MDVESTWRFTESDYENWISGGYTITWINKTGYDISVSVGRLVFEDSDNIQIAEYEFYDETFSVDADETRKRTGNFQIRSTVAAANLVTEMNIWASFSKQ